MWQLSHTRMHIYSYTFLGEVVRKQPNNPNHHSVINLLLKNMFQFLSFSLLLLCVSVCYLFIVMYLMSVLLACINRLRTEDFLILKWAAKAFASMSNAYRYDSKQLYDIVACVSEYLYMNVCCPLDLILSTSIRMVLFGYKSHEHHSIIACLLFLQLNSNQIIVST